MSARSTVSERPSVVTPPEPLEPLERQHRLGISPAQIGGSALAAVSAAVAASYLGVNGTVIGAAVGSIVATIGSATYTASLRRGSDAVRRTAQTVRTTARGTVVSVDDEKPPSRWKQLPWRRLAVASASVLALVLASLTTFELVTGRPVSSITGHTSAHGTTLGDAVTSPEHSRAATPSSKPSQGPSAASSPSAAPSQEPSASPSAQPSDTPSASPSAQPSAGSSTSPAPQTSPGP